MTLTKTLTALQQALFVDHPASVGETYWQHWRHAGSMLLTLLGAACALFVHMWVPAAFPTTASTRLGSMLERNASRQPSSSSNPLYQPAAKRPGFDSHSA